MYTDIFSDDAIFTFADTFGIDAIDFDDDYYADFILADAIADLNSDVDF
jgi:dipeptidase